MPRLSSLIFGSFDLFFVGPTSGGTWVVVDHERFLTDFPCHASGVTYGDRSIDEADS